MKHIILGGSGFVGNAIVRALHQIGHELFVLNRGSRRIAEAHQITADRNDAQAIASAIGGREFDTLIDTNCYQPQQAQIAIDTLGPHVQSAIMISSAAVYSDSAGFKPDEDAETGGASVWGEYGEDKSASEVVYACSSARFDSVIALRPPYIFGPNNTIDRERWFWRRMLHRRPILIPGDGEAQLQFIHEDDLGAAVATVISAGRRPSGFSAYNIAEPKVCSMNAMVAMLARAARIECMTLHIGRAANDIPARHWFPFRDYNCCLDASRFAATFDWKPTASLEARFSETFRSLGSEIIGMPDDWTPLEDRLLAKLKTAHGE